jgi:serine/threonine protein kinase
MQSESQQLVGAVFSGRWRLARLIGEGGMGSVYEAQSTRNEGVRAIKVLHPEFCTEPQVLNRFFAEAEAVRMLSHPNVAQIYEAQRAEDGTPYLVMELLTGMPLSSFRTPGRPVPTNQAAPIIYGILQALALAHSRGVIHRDLKPDNLFLVPDGKGQFIVKVLDFGIAKVMDAAGGMGSKTKTGVLLGTPGYMSPEQIKNSKAVDPRSDLWSVGIILYEMLTGREAFPADNEFTRLTAVLTQDIPPIGQVNPGLSAWSGFFQRALSKDPNGRFGNASEMAQALMVSAGQGKSPSAQGRDWGTVMLQLPQGQQAQPSGGPPTGAYANQQGHLPYAGPMSGGAPYSNHAQPGSQHQQFAGTQLAPGSAQPYASNAISIHVQPAGPQPARLPSTPPPGPTGPATHVSGQRPPGMPAMASQPPPQVPVIAAPPVGFPLWVLIAVGVGAFALGLTIGAVAFH